MMMADSAAWGKYWNTGVIQARTTTMVRDKMTLLSIVLAPAMKFTAEREKEAGGKSQEGRGGKLDVRKRVGVTFYGVT